MAPQTSCSDTHPSFNPDSYHARERAIKGTHTITKVHKPYEKCCTTLSQEDGRELVLSQSKNLLLNKKKLSKALWFVGFFGGMRPVLGRVLGMSGPTETSITNQP